MWTSDKKKIIVGIILIFLIVFLGYLRETIFININYIIEQLYFSKDVEYYKVHYFYKYLLPLEVGGLLKFKWFLTILFMLLNLGLSYLILKTLFVDSKQTIRLLFWGYIFLFALSGVIYIIGNLTGNNELGYTLSRRFMGVLQSPVPLMVVAAVHLIFGSTNKAN